MSGADEVVAALQAWRQRLQETIPDALQTAADDLLAQSEPLVPVDTGALIGTGTTAVDAGSFTAAVGYGDSPERAIVAIVQHERHDFNHPGGGQSNYLGQPTDHFGPQLLQHMAAGMEAAL